MEKDNKKIGKTIIQTLHAVKYNEKSIGTAYKELAILLGLDEPLFPVYQKGTPVEWQGQGTNFYIMEDNGDYNALISTSMNIEDPTYNDWWIDKTFLRLIIKENL
jgi:hypothetical protein